MTKLRRAKSACALALSIGVTGAGLQACNRGDIGSLGGPPCVFVCPVDGIWQGNASISGTASVDAFFAAVVSIRDASTTLNAGVRAEIEGMAASLQIDVSGLHLEAASAAVQAAIQTKLDAHLQGGLTIRFQLPKCESSVDVAVQAATECDLDVDPALVTVACEGACTIEASAAAECSDEATVTCQGTAPNLACDGTCKGTCQLEAAANCDGACKGACAGACSACVGGTCNSDGAGGVTNCAGSCDAMCTGSCELSAGGSCAGSCEGSCDYTPPSGSCEAGASVKCEPAAMSSVECEGTCEGSIRPPEVSAECKATVDAKTKAQIQCTPPSLDASFVFAADVDAQAQAEFRAWLKGFKLRFASLLAARAKLEFVGQASADAADTGKAAIEGAATALSGGDADLKTIVGLGCALDQLQAFPNFLGGISSDVSDSLSAIVTVGASVGAVNWEAPLRYDVYAPVSLPE